MICGNKVLGQYLFFISIFCLISCNNREVQDEHEPIDYIRAIAGESDSIPKAAAQKGAVLIAYSDCYTCHKESQKLVGPAFKDIAKRYPVQNRFIDMLAYKIISGGYGAWGNTAMSDHSTISHEDAKQMVSYILSLKEVP
jgi:cytochrome c